MKWGGKLSRGQPLVDTKIIKGTHTFASDRSKWADWSYKIQVLLERSNVAAGAALECAADCRTEEISKVDVELENPSS